jgi:hypothetical protein
LDGVVDAGMCRHGGQAQVVPRWMP